jgi:UDP-N-acetylmuramoylalanine--D-glutamate ligase
MNKDSFKGSRVLVMGLGRFGGGTDSAAFAAAAGAKVIVTDLAGKEELAQTIEQLKDYKNITYHLAGHNPADFKNCDYLIVNPAVPPDNKFIETAKLAGAQITSQIEIFFQLSPSTIVAITGSNGKSTTTALTAHLLEAAIAKGDCKYRKVWLGGNIGDMPLLGRMGEMTADDIAVLEISSFQIDQLTASPTKNIGPAVALVTNVTPNHLDRHGTFDEYCRVKKSLFEMQARDDKNPAVSIFNADDEITAKWFTEYSKQTGRKSLQFATDDISERFARHFTLPGRANRSNLAGAISIARHFGAGDDCIAESAGKFKGLNNRLQIVAEINGVGWYDDSIATTPVSAIVALKAFAEPKIIIAGGYDKGIDFSELGTVIGKMAKAAVLIGVTAEKIAVTIPKAGDGGVTVRKADSMEEAVKIAAGLAGAGDVVLLSPACASYDMFDNYRARGQAFSKAVKRLPQKL